MLDRASCQVDDVSEIINRRIFKNILVQSAGYKKGFHIDVWSLSMDRISISIRSVGSMLVSI